MNPQKFFLSTINHGGVGEAGTEMHARQGDWVGRRKGGVFIKGGEKTGGLKISAEINFEAIRYLLGDKIKGEEPRAR